MTIALDSKRRKPPKNFAQRMLEQRNRLAAKVPAEDWKAVPTDASLRLEEYMEGKL